MQLVRTLFILTFPGALLVFGLWWLVKWMLSADSSITRETLDHIMRRTDQADMELENRNTKDAHPFGVERGSLKARLRRADDVVGVRGEKAA